MCGCKDIKRGWSPYLPLLPPTMEITVIIVNVLPLPPNDDVQWGLPGCSQQPGRGDPLWSASNGGKWRLLFGCGCCCSPLQLPLIFLSSAASWFYFCVDLFVFCPFFSLFHVGFIFVFHRLQLFSIIGLFPRSLYSLCDFVSFNPVYKGFELLLSPGYFPYSLFPAKKPWNSRRKKEKTRKLG